MEESSGSIDRELREAVDRSDRSFRGAAEGRRAVVSPVDAMSAAQTVKGESCFAQLSDIGYLCGMCV